MSMSYNIQYANFSGSQYQKTLTQVARKNQATGKNIASLLTAHLVYFSDFLQLYNQFHGLKLV